MAAKSQIRTLILIRGVPGSGGTTLARAICAGMGPALVGSTGNGWFWDKPSIVHFEQDMFFMDKGTYKYDDTKQNAADMWCEENVRRAMENSTNIIVVSNKFVRLYEISPYFALAKAHKYNVQEIIVDAEFTSIHHPPEKVERCRRMFQFRPRTYELGAINIADHK